MSASAVPLLETLLMRSCARYLEWKQTSEWRNKATAIRYPRAALGGREREREREREGGQRESERERETNSIALEKCSAKCC